MRASLLIFSLFVLAVVLNVSALDSRSRYEKVITGQMNTTISGFESYKINRFIASTVHNFTVTGHCNDAVPCNLYLVSKESYLKAINQESMDNVESVTQITNVGSLDRTLSYIAQEGENFESLFQGLYLIYTSANTTVFEATFKVGIVVDISWIQMIVNYLFGTVKHAIITSAVLLGIIFMLLACITVTCCCCCCSNRSREYERMPLRTNTPYYNAYDNRNNRIL